MTMLRRVIILSQGTVAQKDGPPLAPFKILDGFGHLQQPQPYVLPIAGVDFERADIGPKHPPGFYGTQISRRALNLSSKVDDVQAQGDLPDWARSNTYATLNEVDLRPWMFGIAMALFLVDLIATLILRGMFKFRRAGTVSSILLCLCLSALAAG
ncbi:MAG: hypothetical protein RIB59_03265, partial [Rhodospirillales bacterium]